MYIAQTVKHPASAMAWSCMSAKGTGRLYTVESTMRQGQYKTVLERRLMLQIRDWFPNGDFVFIQDSAQCYKAKSVMNFLVEKGIEVLP